MAEEKRKTKSQKGSDIKKVDQKETTNKKTETSKAKTTKKETKVTVKPEANKETKPVTKTEKKETVKTVSVKAEPKATKVETKPITPKYISSKEAKNPKRGKSGITLLIIVIILISIFFINVFRKYVILVDLSKKVNNYVTSQNYHEIATYERDFKSDGFTKIETYRKGNTAKSIMHSPVKGVITQLNSTTAGSKMFIDGKDGKILTYDNNNKELWLAIEPQDMIGEAKFLNSLYTGVKSKKIDGIDCYVLDNKMFSSVLWSGEPCSYNIYIEKATGLVKQLEQKQEVNGVMQTLKIKYSYQFDNIKDEDLRAPSDIGQYIIKN